MNSMLSMVLTQAPGIRTNASRRCLEKFWRALLPVACAALPFMLVYRSIGMYPSIFADEYLYSRWSRLEAIEKAEIPNYLYLFIFQLTWFGGDQFFACAKILNAIFYTATIPIIYLCGRLVASHKHSLMVGLLAAASPLSAYTAYFMPESTFFFFFWLLTYLLLLAPSRDSTYFWMGTGAVFGLLMLVKPHGLFLFPSIAGYLLLLHRGLCVAGFRLLQHALLFFATAIAVKLCLGFFIAGPTALTLLGPLYSRLAVSPESTILSRLSLLAEASLLPLRGHAIAVVLLYGVPIAITCSLLAQWYPRSSAIAHQRALAPLKQCAVWTFCTMTTLVLVASVFTALLSTAPTHESLLRLHMRYYNFALPLFYVLAAGFLSTQPAASGRPLRTLVGVALLCVAVYAAATRTGPFISSLIDNPELHGIRTNSVAFAVSAVLLVFSLGLWCVVNRSGTRVYLFLAAPVTVLVGGYFTVREQRGRLIPDAFDRAGVYARHAIPQAEVGAVVVVGHGPASVLRTLSYIDSAEASHAMLEQGATYDLDSMPIGKHWALVVGGHPVVGKHSESQVLDGFTLARRPVPLCVDFRAGGTSNDVRRIDGLHAGEAWGAWSCAKFVEIEFTRPLPETFTLQVVANAFGPNCGKDVMAGVGDELCAISFGPNHTTCELTLANPKHSSQIRFIIPEPTSPLALGVGDDARVVGIGFVSLCIQP